MEDSDIALVNGSNLEQIALVLRSFLNTNEQVFQFPSQTENQRVKLWEALFKHLESGDSSSIHGLCLSTLRILSRDKTELEHLMTKERIVTIVERAGLYDLIGGQEDTTINREVPSKDIQVEAVKCLCNISFNSEMARAYCAEINVAKGIIGRLRMYKEIPFKEDIMLYDMKLLFILSALRHDIRLRINRDLDGLDYLINCQRAMLEEAAGGEELGAVGGGAPEPEQCYFNDIQLATMCEILKTQFNLVTPTRACTEEADEAACCKLLPVLARLLRARTPPAARPDLRANVANLLTSIPTELYGYLCPEVHEGEVAEHEYLGRNMDALHVLLDLLRHRLDITTSTRTQNDNLSPVLTVLIKAARGSREQRKYLREAVLPPLRDVNTRPEEGDTLRNRLCRLLTTPVTAVRDLVAELLFVLCKENVGRMVKYTGFGNAAGHLAQQGLLRGAAPPPSSSDDSDTEEYINAQAAIDPIVGCMRPHHPSPFAGMSEEQKEYEAMQLVHLFDRMLALGAVRPAQVGADGRPQPLEHVLQLRPDVRRDDDTD